MKTYKLKANMWKVLDKDVEVDIDVTEDTLRELIKNNPELTKDKPVHIHKFSNPQDNETYYAIGSDYVWKKHTYLGNISHVIRGVYATPEQAVIADKKRIFITRLWNWADNTYPFKPDWNNINQNKYWVFYSHVDGLETYDDVLGQSQFTLPYFECEDHAREFINKHKDDLIFLFTN